VPVVAPVTVPEERPTEATDVLPLLHVPPVVVFPNDTVKPAHTVSVPDISDGNGFTVMVVIMIQPVGKAYVTEAVFAATPVTTPVPGITVATVVLPLAQVPPLVASFNADVRPTQMLAVPPMFGGNGLTVTIVLTWQPVPNI
jgi:hypothetical protein